MLLPLFRVQNCLYEGNFKINFKVSTVPILYFKLIFIETHRIIIDVLLLGSCVTNIIDTSGVNDRDLFFIYKTTFFDEFREMNGICCLILVHIELSTHTTNA